MYASKGARQFRLDRWMQSDQGKEMVAAAEAKVGMPPVRTVQAAGLTTTWLHPQLAVLLAPRVYAELAFSLLNL